MSRAALQVEGLAASIGGLDILKGVDLVVPFGEMHAIMGPNGSGKSTLCHVLAGNPGYRVSGTVLVDGLSITGMGVDERARAGLFLAFQYPVEVPGLELAVFLEEAAISLGVPVGDAGDRIAREAGRFGMEPFLDRAVNGGLSGGEKKRSEVFQMAVLEPRVMVLDEIDSGLDIDTVREVAQAVSAMRSGDVAVLMITHYSRILNHVKARQGPHHDRRTYRRVGRVRAGRRTGSRRVRGSAVPPALDARSVPDHPEGKRPVHRHAFRLIGRRVAMSGGRQSSPATGATGTSHRPPVTGLTRPVTQGILT